MKRIYLDVCSLQRPLDDRTQLRINVEAEAILAVLLLVETGHIEMLTSEVIQFEIDQISDPERRERVAEIIKLAGQVIELSDEIEALADSFVKAGIKPLDALYLASASATRADFFCTCDDKLLKKSQGLAGLTISVVSPLQLIAEVAP